MAVGFVHLARWWHCFGRRAIKLRLAGEERWTAAADAGTYRDAFGAVPPSGLPDTFLAAVPDPLERIWIGKDERGGSAQSQATQGSNW